MSLTSYRFLGATKFRFLGDTLRPEIRMAQSHNPAHGFKNCINNTPHCGVDVARDYQSHAGRNTCCTLGSGAFVTRKSVHHTCHLRVFAGSPTRRTVDMTQHWNGGSSRRGDHQIGDILQHPPTICMKERCGG